MTAAEKSSVYRSTFDASRAIRHRSFNARASAISGTRRLEKDVRKAMGKVSTGMTIASVIPYCAKAPEPLAPYLRKPKGISRFSTVTKADFR